MTLGNMFGTISGQRPSAPAKLRQLRALDGRAERPRVRQSWTIGMHTNLLSLFTSPVTFIFLAN
jgi:hypothetical protein